MKKATKSAMVFLSLCAAFLLFSCSADNSIESKDKYTINIVPSANGVVTASAETAEQGKTITLTVIPDSGYRLAPDSLAVIGLEGNLNDAGADADGYKQYSFIMPGKGLLVVCSFELIPEEGGSKTINLAAGMTGGTVLISPAFANFGETVTLTVAVDSGYRYLLDSLKINGSTASLTAITNDEQNRPRFTFSMPDETVNISCSFTAVPANQPFFITIDNTSNGSIIAVYEQTQSAAKGEVYISITPDKDYRMKTGSFTLNGSPVEINYFGKDGSIDVWFFVMPAADILVSCIFEPDEPEYFSKDYDESLCSFSDKFDGSGTNLSSGGLNLDKWGFQNGNGTEYGNWGWGNSERQSYRTENVTVADGILTITAKYTSTLVNGQNYTSGKIVTAKSKGLEALGEPEEGMGVKFGQSYGRFEAKIRMNAGKGAWPALWMMPVESVYGGWPRSGEIDIMEMTGINKTHSSSTIHRAAQSSGSGQWYKGTNQTFAKSSTFEDWHIYGVLWTQNEMIFLIDGKEHGRHNITDARFQPGGNNRVPFDQDFHFIINLALDSGQFNKDNGIGTNETDLNYTLEVDWVRAYTLANDPWEILGKVTGSPYNN